jgi:Flp pilus assembly protein TadG
VTGRRDIRAQDGQTAVEFALVLPILAVLLLAIIQLGIAFNAYVTLTDATRAGARKAIVARLSGGSVAEAQQTVRDSAGALDQTKLQVSVDATDWTQAGSVVTVTATYPYKLSLLTWMGGWVPWNADLTLTSTMKERLE